MRKVNIRQKQYAPVPAAVKAAGAIIHKNRGCSLDITKERVGYGRKPQLPPNVVVETFEKQWLEAILLESYSQLKPVHPGYTGLVHALVDGFTNRYRGIDL